MMSEGFGFKCEDYFLGIVNCYKEQQRVSVFFIGQFQFFFCCCILGFFWGFLRVWSSLGCESIRILYRYLFRFIVVYGRRGDSFRVILLQIVELRVMSLLKFLLGCFVRFGSFFCFWEGVSFGLLFFVYSFIRVFRQFFNGRCQEGSLVLRRFVLVRDVMCFFQSVVLSFWRDS